MNYSNSNIICVQETLLKSNLGFIIYILAFKRTKKCEWCRGVQYLSAKANNITQVVVIDVCKKKEGHIKVINF